MRSNCIDSLDRTNFAQEMIGYHVSLRQFESMGIIKDHSLQMKSSYFYLLFDMYNRMGDEISL